MNVITLLTNDHRTVEGLLERYRSATDEAKQALLDEITPELMKHMDAEETVLYPLLRTSILDGEKLMADAIAEHNKAKGLLAELQNTEAGSFEMDSRISTLRKAIAHHVREEEESVFPEMQKSLDAALLERIGGQIEDAKRGRVVTAATDRLKDAATGKE
jgi:hemerythrin superfamily protein